MPFQTPRFSHPDKKIREFIWHKRSLFPNNFLHFTEYKSEVNFETEANNFKDIIYSCKNELEIQQYIKQQTQSELHYIHQNFSLITYNQLHIHFPISALETNRHHDVLE